MSKRDDGGPAFARSGFEVDLTNQGPNDTKPQDGMSLRAYLVAHAPAQPTFRFEVRMPTPRPVPVLNDDRECANEVDCREWDDERERQRMIQWPCVWADAMLSEMNR